MRIVRLMMFDIVLKCNERIKAKRKEDFYCWASFAVKKHAVADPAIQIRRVQIHLLPIHAVYALLKCSYGTWEASRSCRSGVTWPPNRLSCISDHFKSNFAVLTVTVSAIFEIYLLDFLELVL